MDDVEVYINYNIRCRESALVVAKIMKLLEEFEKMKNEKEESE